MNTPQGAYNFLVNYVNENGAAYSGWYAGIAADPRDRLISGHGVEIDQDAWAYDFVPTSEEARQVEVALIALGCGGRAGGGDNTTNGIYVYKKTRNTRE